MTKSLERAAYTRKSAAIWIMLNGGEHLPSFPLANSTK